MLELGLLKSLSLGSLQEREGVKEGEREVGRERERGRETERKKEGLTI